MIWTDDMNSDALQFLFFGFMDDDELC